MHFEAHFLAGKANAFDIVYRSCADSEDGDGTDEPVYQCMHTSGAFTADKLKEVRFQSLRRGGFTLLHMKVLNLATPVARHVFGRMREVLQRRQSAACA